MWLVHYLLYGVLFVLIRGEQDVQLEIPQGILKGLKTESILHNKPYYSFKGIPYAKPNVGPHKFRTPEPADSWDGVYDATQHRSVCPFYCMIKKGLIGDEDCLYLNVYTPVLDKEAGKAVMVFLHPGGWNAGMADDMLFGPDFLVEHDVVVVTLNYRLGALGYLNTQDKNAPGNAGMKDQVLALKWVKDNIHFFGGCPNRVTLVGHCSGGASVMYHMLSPMSEGLFTAAIVQSGNILNPWAITYNSRELAFKLGESLGIHTTDSAELVQKLTEFHVKDIVDATIELDKTLNPLNGRLISFVPSVEADMGQDIFLPNDPWTMIKSGRLANVPFLTGLTKDEGIFFAQGMLDSIELLNTEPDIFLPDDLNFTDTTWKKKNGECLRNHYFGEKQISKDDLKEYATMIGDIYVKAGEVLSLEIIKNRNSAPVFEYLYTYEAPTGFMKNLHGVTDGAAHGDELYYIFYSHAFKNLPEPGSPAEKMTNMITKMWTNFAKDGYPSSKMDNDVTVKWEPVGSDGHYLVIDQELKLEKDLEKDVFDFWKGKYKDVMP
nr:PREDICTED: esterase FE4-like [Megachile rotundata]